MAAWLLFIPLTAARAETTPYIEQSFSGIPLFSANAKLCVHAVTVCGRELQPLGVALGGSFTVRIEDHYKSTYECAMINGAPSWIATSTEGNCETAPVITLPAKYDEEEGWNVG